MSGKEDDEGCENRRGTELALGTAWGGDAFAAGRGGQGGPCPEGMRGHRREEVRGRAMSVGGETHSAGGNGSREARRWGVPGTSGGK